MTQTMHGFKLLIIIAVAISSLFGVFTSVYAAPEIDCKDPKNAEVQACIDARSALNVPRTVADGNLVDTILNIVFALIGAIAVLVIVIAGFQFVISSGEPDKVAKARQTIIYAVVGLIVTISAATIVNFVLGSVIK